MRHAALSPIPFSGFALVAAAGLAGCASSERLARISPMAADSRDAKGARTPLSDDRVNLFPIYYGASGVNAVLWPLIDWDERGFAFRPVYNREDANASVLWPLSGWDAGGGSALNTVWAGDDFLFLPFAGRWNGVSFAGPFFSSSDGDYGFVPVFGRYGDTFQFLNTFIAPESVAVYPFYYGDKDRTWIAELYASSRRDGYTDRRSLLGVGFYSHEADDGSSGWLWSLPGYFSRHGGEYRESYSLLHGEGRDEHGSWLNIHPLLWSHESETGRFSMLIPVWYSRHDTPGDSTITPLWSYGRGAGRSWFNVHPFWWSSNGEKASSNGVFPLWYATSGISGTFVLTPLGGWGKNKAGDAHFANVLGIAGHWSDDGAGGKYVHVLWPLFGRHSEAVGPDESIRTPTIVASEASDGYSGFRITPLITVQHSENGVRMNRWFPHLADFRSGKDSSEWYAFPLGYGEAHKDGGSALRITPLFSASDNTPEPLWWSWAHLYRSHADKTGRAWSVTPLVASETKDDKSFFRVFPFYTSRTDGDASEWSLLFGLAGGRHKGGEGRDSVLRYLYDREVTKDGVRMNCFPFIRNDSLKDRETFAFLWRVFDRETDLKTGETKGHVFFVPY